MFTSKKHEMLRRHICYQSTIMRPLLRRVFKPDYVFLDMLNTLYSIEHECSVLYIKFCIGKRYKVDCVDIGDPMGGLFE